MIDVPLRRTPGGNLVVHAAVDGGPELPFLVDTGASGTLVAEEHLPPGHRDRRSRAPAEPVHAAGGELPGGARVLAGTLRLGGGTLPFETLTVLPLAALSGRLGVELGGIVGTDAFRDGDLRLDLIAGRLVAGDLPDLSGLRFARQPFRWLDGQLIVVDLPDDVTAILDTGAAVTVLNDFPGADTGADADAGATAYGLGETAVTATPATFGPVVFGGHRSPVVTAYRAGLPVFADLGLTDGPAVLLGVDFLAGRVLDIRFPDQVLLLSVTEEADDA